MELILASTPAQTAALGLFILGAVLALIGGIGLLIAGFRESVLWGLGMLFLPVVSLIFVLLHWREAKNPFLLQILGVGLVIASSLVGGGLPTA